MYVKSGDSLHDFELHIYVEGSGEPEPGHNPIQGDFLLAFTSVLEANKDWTTKVFEKLDGFKANERLLCTLRWLEDPEKHEAAFCCQDEIESVDFTLFSQNRQHLEMIGHTQIINCHLIRDHGVKRSLVDIGHLQSMNKAGNNVQGLQFSFYRCKPIPSTRAIRAQRWYNELGSCTANVMFVSRTRVI